MIKKISIILILNLLIIIFLPMVCSEDKNEYYNINDFFCDKQIGCVISFDLDKSDLNNDSIKPKIMNYLPDFFSWKSIDGQDWTTSAKNQGNCGSCWAFAAIGALESAINIRANNPDLDLDLSEQYILSCLPHAGSCDGGNARDAWYSIRLTTAWGNYCNGIIPEQIFPYQANDEIPCENKSENWEDYLIPISDFGQWRADGSPEDIQAIKSQILQSGPVTASMFATGSFARFGSVNHNPNEYFSYPGPITGINHQVVIVGWKDDLNIGNGGYWICKNSWGENWGYNGFFNIEYGSLNIDNSVIGWVSLYPTFLNCEGSINLVDIKPGETITDNFTIENVGSPFSNLEWEIIDWPDWGEWSFMPKEGNNLSIGEGQKNVEISVLIPDKNKEIYNGNITIINKGLESDYEIIPISITTNKNKQKNFSLSKLFQNFSDLYPILKQMIYLI